MEELSSNRNYQYGKLSKQTFDSMDKSKFVVQNNGGHVNGPKNMENGTIGRTSRLPDSGSFGVTCKVSLVSLKRVGSALSFVPSRKSSVRSVSSKTSIESNKSQIRKNSGQFDGCNSRMRKHSSGCKVSTSTQSRKISSTSQKDQIIAEIYRELEQLKEFEFSSSSEEEDDDNNNVHEREDLERQKRVELYVKRHSHLYKKLHYDIDAEIESTNNNTNTTPNKNNHISTNNTTTTNNNKNNNDNNNNNNNDNKNNNDDTNNNKNNTNNTNNNNNNTNEDSDINEIEHLSVVNSNNLHNVVINIEQEDNTDVTNPTTIIEPMIRLKKQKKRYSTKISDVNDGLYSTHTQMTSNRLTKLFLDSREVNVNDAFHIVPKDKDKQIQPKTIINPTYYNYLQLPSEMRLGPRGSINSLSSYNTTLSNSDSVPMNFIPGQTKPIPRDSRSNSLSFNYIQKAKFCFKGIMCQVDRSTPKTYKAMAHAGMLSISIIGPSDHRCSH